MRPPWIRDAIFRSLDAAQSVKVPQDPGPNRGSLSFAQVWGSSVCDVEGRDKPRRRVASGNARKIRLRRGHGSSLRLKRILLAAEGTSAIALPARYA